MLNVWQCINTASSGMICGHDLSHSFGKMITQCAVNPATALGLFKTLDVPKGEWMLQTAAGSGLGATLCCCLLHLPHRALHKLADKRQCLRRGSSSMPSMSLWVYVPLQLSWLAPPQGA